MAVQAQHQKQFLESPSSLLFLGGISNNNNNNNNSLEGIDAGGSFSGDCCRFLPQQQLLLLLQQQQQQQQQQQLMMALPPMNHQFLPMGYNSPPSNCVLPTDFAHSLASHMEKQKQEIDQFLRLQNERLRMALNQQRKQHLVSLMRRVESKALGMLGKKEEEIAMCSKKTMELEECLRRAEIENQKWQRVAKENEAMAMALSNTLDQMRDTCCFSSTWPPAPVPAPAEDLASCCDSNPNNVAVEEEEEEAVGLRCCKGCSSRDSCMLFLPCMHLCSCKFCEGLLSSCPICRSVKEGSIEVFFG